MAVLAAVFFDHIDAYLDYRKGIYETSPQTLKSNLVDLNLFKNFIGNDQDTLINGPAAMNFQYYLKTNRNNCGGSINRKIFTLRSYSGFLKLHDIPGADKLPFYDVLKIRQGYRNRPDALTTKQVKTLFESIDRTTCLGIRDYAVYALMYQTGLRVGEVFNLNLQSIDSDEKKLSVIGKGNKLRVLPLTEETFQILAEWLAVRPHFFKSSQSHALFVSKKGNRLAIRTMEDNFKKLLTTSKIETHFNVTCHTLRHSFASHLNDKDIDIFVIQSLLGHSTPRSTDPYIHPSLEKIRQALEKLPGVIYLNELVKSGMLNLTFQNNRPKKE
jgi:site-specific recombinase XerD